MEGMHLSGSLSKFVHAIRDAEAVDVRLQESMATGRTPSSQRVEYEVMRVS